MSEPEPSDTAPTAPGGPPSGPAPTLPPLGAYATRPPARPATDSGPLHPMLQVAVLLLVVVVVLQAWALVAMNSKMNTLQHSVSQVSTTPDLSSVADSQTAYDACQLLGALAKRAGVDLAAVFPADQRQDTCVGFARTGSGAVRAQR